jgi:hypothetical protein
MCEKRAKERRRSKRAPTPATDIVIPLFFKRLDSVVFGQQKNRVTTRFRKSGIFQGIFDHQGNFTWWPEGL